MTDRLWTGGETIGLPNNSDGGAAGITTAITTQFLSAGNVTGIQYRAPDTATGTWMIAMWEVTATDDTPAGTLLASKTVTVSPGVFQDLLFDTPVAIVPTTKVYRFGVWNSQGRYVATLGVFSGFDITSPGGFIKAWHNGDDTVGLGSIRNGSFKDNAALTYPALGGGAWYGMGPVFEPAGADLNIADVTGGMSAGSTSNALTVGVAIADSPGGTTLGSTPNTVIPGAAVDIADTPGGAVAGSTPTTVVTSNAVADTAVMPLLISIMGCLQAELMRVTSPPQNFHIRPGATFSPMPDDHRDECCEGIAWVRPGVMFESVDFPQQLSTVYAPGTSQWALQVELGVERCIPLIGPGGGDPIPTGAQWLAATQAAMDDRAALRRAICCVRALLGQKRVVVGQITPLENEGNCGGEVVILTIALQACDC